MLHLIAALWYVCNTCHSCNLCVAYIQESTRNHLLKTFKTTDKQGFIENLYGEGGGGGVGGNPNWGHAAG